MRNRNGKSDETAGPQVPTKLSARWRGWAMDGREGRSEGGMDGGPAKVDYADSGPHRLYIPRKTVGR